MNYVYAFCILFVIGLIISFRQDPLLLKLDAHLAAKEAVPWLLAHQDEITDPGVLWILSKINTDYCDSSEATTKLVAKLFQHFERSEIERTYERLINNDATFVISTSSLQDRTDSFDDTLIPALYCDNQPELIAPAMQKIQELSQGEHYQTTHALLGLVWLKERNCLSKEQETYVEVLAKIIQKQQSEDSSFGDIFAERAAFLQYAGYSDLVPPDWIQTIIDKQEPSGGWKTKQDSHIFGITENTHTTSLSLWALTQFTHRCPF